MRISLLSRVLTVLMLAGSALSASAKGVALVMEGNPPTPPGSFQLTDCKRVNDWEVLIGQCQSAGSFTGQGALRRNGMVYLGPAKDGLPHGTGNLCMDPLPRYRAGETIDCSNDTLFCEANFEAGRITDQSLQCRALPKRDFYGRTDPKDHELKLVLRSATGFGIDDGLSGPQHSIGFGRVSTLVADLVDVEISGAMVYDPLPSGYQRGPSTAIGKARQIKLGATEFTVSQMNGTLTIHPNIHKYSPRGIPEGAMVVKGTFDAKLATVSRFSPSAYKRLENGSFPRESLVTISYQGKTHQLVYAMSDSHLDAQSPIRQQEVVYFKDPSGVEFDGTGPACTALKRRGVARLSAVSYSGSSGFAGEFELKPSCGTITTPTGSYTGRFENGRPAN